MSLAPSAIQFRDPVKHRVFDLQPSSMNDVLDVAIPSYAYTTIAGKTASPTSLQVPYYCCILDIPDVTQTYTTGIIKDANNLLQLTYTGGSGTLALDGTTGGVHDIFWSATVSISNGDRIAFVLTGTVLSAWIHSGPGHTHDATGWTLQTGVSIVTGFSVAHDYRPESMILACKGFFSGSPSKFECGVFGTIGTQNQFFVTDINGNLLTDGGSKCYVHGVSFGAGPGSWVDNFYTEDIFTYDMGTGAFAFLSKLYGVRNDGAGNLRVPFVGGSTLWDAGNSQWILDFGSDHTIATYYTKIYHLTTATDILAPGLHVLSGWTRTLTADSEAVQCYDPARVKIGSTWYLAYTETDSTDVSNNYRQVINDVTNPAAPTLVGRRGSYDGSEGSSFFKAQDGTVYALSTKSDGTFPYYDPTSYTLAGYLDFKGLDYSFASIKPDPTVAVLPAGYGGGYILGLFDYEAIGGSDHSYGNWETLPQQVRYLQTWDGMPATGQFAAFQALDWQTDPSIVATTTNAYGGSGRAMEYAPGSGLVTNTYGVEVGNATVSSLVRYDAFGSGETDIGIFARKTVKDADYATVTGYFAILQRGVGNDLLLFRKNSGTLTSLASLGSGSAFADGEWYRIEMRMSDAGTTPVALSVLVQRMSDSKWLNNSAAWQTGRAVAITYSDSSGSAVLARGYVGLLMYGTNGSPLRADNFIFTPNPISVTTTGTPTGAAGNASTAVTVSLDGFANGSDTITLTSSNAGDTFTASDSTTGTHTITVPLAFGATSFTFTINRPTAGASTITYTNGQGWTDPGTTSYTATSATSLAATGTPERLLAGQAIALVATGFTLTSTLADYSLDAGTPTAISLSDTTHGTLTITAPGTPTVTVTTQGVVSNSLVTVGPQVDPDYTGSPSAVTGTTISLVSNADAGGGAEPLTYAWTCTAKPVGAASPTFSNSATSNTTATVFKAGDYTFKVTATDNAGASAEGTIDVTVAATYTSVAVSPSSASVLLNGTQTFTATKRDQFGADIAGGTFTWSVPTGTGTINSSTGVFTAPAGAESDVVRATSGGIHGDANVSVVVALPVRNNGLSLGVIPISGL